MADNVIGFVGVEKYEIILYLSRILHHLNLKVLLVDLSESEALYSCIPIPKDMRNKENKIDYRGIDFIKNENKLYDLQGNYDVILIDFGFNSYSNILSQCNRILLFTDLQLHNIERIKNMKIQTVAEMSLILKEFINCKITPEFITTQIGYNIDKEQVYVFHNDIIDMKYKIHSQYDDCFHFKKLSRSYKQFLKDVIFELVINIDLKTYRKAYKKAGRGK